MELDGSRALASVMFRQSGGVKNVPAVPPTDAPGESLILRKACEEEPATAPCFTTVPC